jgi:hypothetical protein
VRQGLASAGLGYQQLAWAPEAASARDEPLGGLRPAPGQASVLAERVRVRALRASRTPPSACALVLRVEQPVQAGVRVPERGQVERPVQEREPRRPFGAP